MLEVSDRIRIPLRELHFSYSRSSGPGGQNVNKLNTKVTLRWNVATSPSLDDALRERFLTRHRRRITTGGQLVIHSQRFRDQARNVADCYEKLRALLLEVASPPRSRKPTRPSRRAVARRLESKRRHSETKQRRRKPRGDD